MKNTINLMIAWAIVCAVFVLSNSAFADTCGIKGDVNGDHKVDLREAIYALQVAVGIQPKQTIDEDEAEPNNIQENSNPISEDTVVTGNIGSGDDGEDWYKIIMPANGLIQYSLENLNEVGTEQGIIGITRLYQKIGLDLIELNSISVKNGYETYNAIPQKSLLPKQPLIRAIFLSIAPIFGWNI